LLVVRPSTATEALWAAEQALSSGVCAAVLLWLKGTDDRWLRRLKLAAEAGGSLGVSYLQTTLQRRFFPELWEVRTVLGGTPA